MTVNEVRQPQEKRPNSACNPRSGRFSQLALSRENTREKEGAAGASLWSRLESSEAPAIPKQIQTTAHGQDTRELSDDVQKRGTHMKLRPSSAVNPFTALVERTVDALKRSTDGGAYEDAQRILSNIRKQYDEVHAEAEKKEAELMDVRKEVRLVETDDKPDPQIPEKLAYSNVSRDSITKQMNDVSRQMDESQTTKRVLSHMVARLKHEQNIVEQKIKAMEDHLDRKTRDVQKRQGASRRVHGDKVQSILELESMEHEMESERGVCNTALDDLELTLQQHRNEVRRREDFERWRYEVAMEAASEAFHAMAGRFRKIYAIEKLTGNCLQKIIFEQAEQSQATEDGFQKIREVTGLTDVMDIVHKFLNRDVEHEQLRVSVREAEKHLERLHGLREAEMNKHSEGIGYDGEGSKGHLRGLNSEVAEDEQKLHKAQRDLEDFQQRLRNTTLLTDNIMQWARRMAQSLSSFEELDEINIPQDLVSFFHSFKHSIERFFESANEQMTTSKLAKVTSHACSKEYAEQQKLLNDKDFMRINCRVQVSMDGSNAHRHHHHHHHGHTARGGQGEAEEESNDTDMTQERERLKQESLVSAQEKEQLRRATQQENRRKTRCGDDERGEKMAHIAVEAIKSKDSEPVSPLSARAGPHASLLAESPQKISKCSFPDGAKKLAATTAMPSRPSSRNSTATTCPPSRSSKGGRSMSAGRPGSSRK